MKRYLKEIIILVLQLFMFYIFPLFAGPTDAMGMVLLIILSTLLLSIIIGSISKEKIKYLYPIIVAILFIPSVFIFYNESALIHSIWYLGFSIIGILIGNIIKTIFKKLGGKLWPVVIVIYKQQSMQLTTNSIHNIAIFNAR